jgi:hypothetical protein
MVGALRFFYRPHSWRRRGQAFKIRGAAMSMADRTTYRESNVVSRWPVDPRQPINGLARVDVVVAVAWRERRCGERDENLGKKLWRLLYNLEVKPHTFEAQTMILNTALIFFQGWGVCASARGSFGFVFKIR